jgi:predicted metal-dependent RNase
MNQVAQEIPRKETESMRQARTEFENVLIAVYVPEAEYLNRDESLKLALERDLRASLNLYSDFTTLKMDAGAAVART